MTVRTSISTTPVLFLLFIVFLVLKLTGTIGWSWWWVTAPLWVPSAIVLVVVLIIGFATLCLPPTPRGWR